MKWCEISIQTTHEATELIAEIFNDLGATGVVIEDPELVNDYIKLADLNLVTAVMDGDKMVGFGVTFPSFSRALQKTHDGRLLPMGWWHLLKILKWHKTNVVDLLLIGVLPEYRAKGANALVFDDLIRQFQRYGFEWAETGPMMESNDGVLSQWQYLEAKVNRRHRCYRKKFNE